MTLINRCLSHRMIQSSTSSVLNHIHCVLLHVNLMKRPRSSGDNPLVKLPTCLHLGVVFAESGHLPPKTGLLLGIPGKLAPPGLTCILARTNPGEAPLWLPLSFRINTA